MTELGDNPLEFKDPMEIKFSTIWARQHRTLTSKQKNKIAEIYLKYIIGADDKTISDFVSNKGGYHEIGVVQAGIKPCKNDYSSFWRKVAKITPRDYQEKDLNWLIENNANAWYFISMFDERQNFGELGEWSGVIRRLSTNAHAYK